jgi:mRNA interferase RelE/StbE
MRYDIILKPSAAKRLDKLPQSVRRRVLGALEALADNPRPDGCVKLRGDDNLWRIRVGDYRVVYEIHDKRLLVIVLVIAHRKDVYRK